MTHDAIASLTGASIAAVTAALELADELAAQDGTATVREVAGAIEIRPVERGITLSGVADCSVAYVDSDGGVTAVSARRAA